MGRFFSCGGEHFNRRASKIRQTGRPATIAPHHHGTKRFVALVRLDQHSGDGGEHAEHAVLGRPFGFSLRGAEEITQFLNLSTLRNGGHRFNIDAAEIGNGRLNPRNGRGLGRSAGRAVACFARMIHQRPRLRPLKLATRDQVLGKEENKSRTFSRA